MQELPVADIAPTLRARWQARLSKIKKPLVALAGVGAVLSGFAGWWNTYSTVRHASSPSAAVSTPAVPLAIVVMPFSNQTGDPQKAYIADGLTSSLTADLSRIQDAYVVPAATAYVYRDKGLTVQQLGQAMNVAYVLGGSVITGGEKLRITAQLADARSGAQVWSRSFDGELIDLIALQDQVTTETATSTGNAMVLGAAKRSEKQQGNPSTVELRLRARALSLQPESAEIHKQTQALLRQALVLEPGDASTQAELAASLWLLARNWERPDRLDEQRRQHLAEARQLAVAASAADPENARACRLLAVFAQEDGELNVARQMAERCLALSPRSASLLNDLASTFMYDGIEGARKAVTLLQRGAEIEGAHPQSATQLNLGEALFAAGDSAQAVDHLQMSLRLNPRFTEANLYLAMAYADLGDTAHLNELKAKIDAARVPPLTVQTFGFAAFEKNNSVNTPGYLDLRDKRFLPLWRKAGLPP